MFNTDLQLVAPLRKARSGGSIEGSNATREGLCEPRDSIPLPGHFLSSMLAAEDANSQLSVPATTSTACCHVSHHGLQPSGTLSPNKPFLFFHIVLVMVFTYSTREVTNISLMSRWEMEGSLDRSRDYKMMM